MLSASTGTRSLATTRSRRDLVAAIGATALGLLKRSAVAADCPGLGVRFGCDNDSDCAGCGDAVCQADTCVRPPGGRCRKNAQCASGRCNRKKHKCRPCRGGKTACGGFCDFACHNLRPDSCSCYSGSGACDNDADCCAEDCSAGSPDARTCACDAPGMSCALNLECCTAVCRDGQCTCNDIGIGCTADVQCCSLHCGTNGRCAAPCGNGEPTCEGVCCASGQHCAPFDSTCACNRPLCQGICCPSGTECQGNGLCVSDPNG